MKLLALETTSETGGVALVDGNDVLAEVSFSLKGQASVSLLPSINELLLAQKILPRELDGIAVAVGPGSFTGIRVGIATAQGMAQAAGLPVYGVSSLIGLACQAEADGDKLAVLRPARANEYYFCVFESATQLGAELVAEGRYLQREIIGHLRRLDQQILLLTEGKAAGFASDAGLSGIVVQSVRPRAATIGWAAEREGLASCHPYGEGIVARNYSLGT